MDFLLNMLSHWESVLAVLLVLGGLIFFHELGHFAIARLFGIGVRTFSLGFGPKLFTKRGGKTDYCLSLVPLGGYVSLVGEDEDEEPEHGATPGSLMVEGIEFEESELFSARPAWQRLLVVLGGPVANFAVALLLYIGLAWCNGQTFLLPVVGEVLADSPAQKAGVLAKDRIVTLDGVSIHAWHQVVEGVAAANGAPVHLVLHRQGADVTVSLTPEAKTVKTLFGEDKPAWLMGVAASGETGHTPLGMVEALVSGTQKTWTMMVFTTEGIVKLVQRVVPLDNVGGPIMIAQVVGQQAQQSLSGVLMLAALISINLGILNLLPIPVLDGGHIVFFTLEMIMRRPVQSSIRAISIRVGMFLLISLMVFATWNDLVRLFS